MSQTQQRGDWDLPLIEKQRNRIRELSLILRNRRDENMDVGKHDITLEKCRRLGGGVAAPLTEPLKRQMRTDYVPTVTTSP